MGVVCGLFVGGSGKYVAELQRGWSGFYGWRFHSTLVVDVDPEESLSGPFALGADLVLPETDFSDRMQEIIAQWSGDKFTQDVVRAANRFEASVMHTAAKSLSRIPHAASGGMWTLRTMGLPGIDAFLRSARGLQFISQLRRMLNQARQEYPNEDIILYVVFSTAGGTGAGLSIPLALMVRELVPDVRPTVIPIAILGSVFRNDWGDENNSGSLITRTRGESGTFAVYRELEFLNRKLDMPTVPARREIPTTRPLRYFDTGVARPAGDPRPNFTLAENVFWFGKRSIDAAAQASDCFQELARVYAVLSDPEMTRQIQGHNAFQRSHLRLIPSCVSVEYRRFEAAERLGNQLLTHTLDEALLKEANPLSRPPSFFEGWSPPSSAPITTFIRGQRFNLFTQEGHAATGRIHTGPFVAFLRALVADNTLKGMELIREDDKGGYEATDEDWRELVNRLLQNLAFQYKGLTDKAQQQIDDIVDTEYEATQRWLRKQVLEQSLNSQTAGLGTARQALEAVRQELRGIAQLFNREWPEVIVGDAQGELLPAQEAAQGAVGAARAALYPRSGEVSPSRSRYGFLAAASVLGAGLVSGWLAVKMLDFNPLGGLVSGVAGACLAWLCVRLFRTPARKTKAELRREAVAKLQDAYENLLLATRADYAWTTIRDKFMYALVGSNNRADQASEIGHLMQALRHLEPLLTDLRDSARGRLQTLAHHPPCVLADVGSTLEIPSRRLPALQNAIRGSMQFTVAASELQPGITIELSHKEHIQRFRVEELSDREDDTEKIQRYKALSQHLVDIAQVTTIDANVLPASFTEIVDDANRMAELLIDLGRKANTRGPSCDVENGLVEPTLSYLVVGSEELRALVGQAVNGPVFASGRSERRRILEALREGTAQVSERVGQAVLLFDIWEFGEHQRLEDLKRSQSYYYSIGHPVDPKAEPERYCAGNFEFHIIPELSTAAYIEFQQNLWKPLSLPLLQRLRGCDPRLPGPTVLDLFYLARVENLIEEANGHVWLKTGQCGTAACGDVLLLTTSMYTPDPNDPFGRGRAVVNQFDAFADFMANASGVADAAVATTLTGVGATIMSEKWASLGAQRLRIIKECLAGRFFAVRRDMAKVQALYAHCRKLAEQDAEQMSKPLSDEWLALCRTVFDHALVKLHT